VGRVLLIELDSVQPLVTAHKLSPEDRVSPPKSTDKDLIELGESVSLRMSLGSFRLPSSYISPG
jgi:hypothetical protein